MFDKANQLYHNKNYDSAARLYQQMINDGYCSADLFYNAGNAYYRLNRIGLAIWCYEKAVGIHRDKNYVENLALAKKRIREPIDEIPEIFFIRWWESAYRLFSANTWAVLALTWFLLAMSGLFLNKFNIRISMPAWLKYGAFTLSLYCLFMLMVRAYNDACHFNGIIIEAKTLCTFQNKKEPIFLSEGIKIKVVELHPESTRSTGTPKVAVKLPDGRNGLIDRRALLKL